MCAWWDPIGIGIDSIRGPRSNYLARRSINYYI